jgi:hypothetical protein
METSLQVHQLRMTPREAADVLHGFAELAQGLPLNQVVVSVALEPVDGDSPPTKPARRAKK